ncbi:hypothetical protein BDF22DRAFT_654915 [Syncephalis plumigaleata]|nr:hypothetical protein BDF22DRAFT_654915 [Syncephalis plumigaleata]
MIEAGLIIYALAIWFGINTYKLRRHREGRFRFMQLACFSALGCLTYIIFTVYFLYNLNAREPLDTSYFAKVELVYNMAYLIRALVFLAAFGVHWPLSKAESNKRRTPIEETTIGEHKTMVDEENPLHRQLTRKFTMLTERYMPSTAKQ